MTKLALTALDSTPAAAPAPVSAELPPPSDPIASVPASLPAAASAEEGSWRLVLASLPTEAAALHEAQRLLAKGIDVVIEPGEVKGRVSYRLTFGDYTSRAEAQQALRQERELAGFPRAWPLQLP